MKLHWQEFVANTYSESSEENAFRIIFPYTLRWCWVFFIIILFLNCARVRYIALCSVTHATMFSFVYYFHWVQFDLFCFYTLWHLLNKTYVHKHMRTFGIVKFVLHVNLYQSFQFEPGSGIQNSLTFLAHFVDNMTIFWIFWTVF